ncbi:MAG: sugar ABC transporter substrate-binding protein [Anaerolineae bacterium]|nr:sugar ABC transporter substrate-binding protein [Anaerolineae bacterium]
MKRVIGGLLAIVGGLLALICAPFLLHALVNAIFVLALGQPVPGWWWRLIAPIQNIVALPILAFAFVIKMGSKLSLIIPLIVLLIVQAIGVVLLLVGLKMLRNSRSRRDAALRNVAAFLLPVVLLVGCAKATPEAVAVEAPPGKVLVQWSTWGGSEATALHEQIVADFEAKHPGIKVQLVTVAGFTDYLTKLQTLLAAGTPPDVITLGNEWFPAFLSKGAFQDLSPFVAGDPEVDLDAYIPLTIDVLTRGGKLYALPKDFSVDALYYNLDAFDEAGIPYPDETWTWATLLDAAQKLTTRDASGRVTRYGWSDSGLNMWPWIWQNGGLLFDNEREPTLATLTDPAVVEAAQFYYDLSLKHKVAPNVAELQQVSQRDLFIGGRVAMIYDNVSAQVPFAKIDAFRWDVAVLAKGKQRATPMSENGYAMSASAQYPEEAWALIKYLSSPEAVRVIIGAGGALPCLEALAGSDEYDVRPAFLQSVDFSKPSFSPSQMLDMYAVFRNEQPLMAMGLKSVPDTLASMNDQFNVMLGAK